MKGKKKRLVFLFALTAVLLAGYYGISVISENSKKSAENTGPEAAFTSMENIRDISYSYENETVNLALENEVWISADDPDFPLDQSYPKAMALAFQSVASKEIVKNPESLVEYGLDSPWLSITVKNEQKSETFELGSLSGFLNQYYMLYNGDRETVRTLDPDLAGVFSHSLYSMVDGIKIPPINNFKSFSVKSANGGVDPVLRERTDAGENAPLLWFKADDTNKENPFDNTKIKELIQNLTGLAMDNCLTYKASAEELLAYGLSEPETAVSVVYSPTEGNEKTFDIIFGKASEEGYYASLPGSSFVYIVDKAAVNALSGANYEALQRDAEE